MVVLAEYQGTKSQIFEKSKRGFVSFIAPKFILEKK